MSPLTISRARPRRAVVIALAGLLLLLAATTALAVSRGSVAGAANQWAPVHAGDFPDPDVMIYNHAYYGFATQTFAPSGLTINIQTSTSTNGTTWTASDVDALPNLPSWALSGDTWAPSVAYDAANQEFVMYYAATQASDGDQCIGRAEATSPLGPYVDTSTSPVICQDGADTGSGTVDNGDYGGSIDPDIFTDNGVSTLIWKSDGNHIPGENTYIWSEPLSSNLQSLTGSPTAILAADQTWQSGIVEGPDMVDAGGTDYLFLSGSDEGSSTYAIGYATCPNGPSAACEDSASNPILTSQAGMSGPGGPDVFLSPSGQLDMAFAAWQGDTIGYLSCGIRPMYLASLTITAGVPSLTPATSTASASSPTCSVPPTPKPGYWQVASDGGVFSYGSASFYGSTGNMRLNQPVVGMASTPDGKGYWLVASDGGVFSYGDAHFYGSTGNLRLNKPIIGIIATVDGGGYWLVASDGGVFGFGDAHFYGSTGGDALPYPITAMAPSYLGGGYWLADANGQVFSFGDAEYYGEPPYAPGGYRITGMAGTSDSSGYWLASANGNVADFGDAAPYGSPVAGGVNGAIVGMATTADGAGYWLQGSDGGVFSYGDATFLGSMGGKPLNAPIVGIAAIH
jgi:hypothetical protein